MRKRRKVKQLQMHNNPIMQLIFVVDAVNAEVAKRFQRERTK